MIRLPLNKGDVVQLNNRQYNIEAVIGDGATCIVYSAYYWDSIGLMHHVNLKECYPYNAHVERREQGLVWGIEREKRQCMASFRSAYEKLMIWQNENFAVNVFDLCEANDTLYIIMNADKGKTFDNDNAESLHDILNTVKLLSHFVGKYHENGYLHLDLKPGNFLVYPRPSEHIVLFDMDTVTSIADINDGKVKCISYSDGWAAPEQKQGRISKLCPATDIFSIGAILFEKVMGRPVAASDMSVFADWDFEGELFEAVDPKIQRLLRNIFRKTLAANGTRRYQSTAELISDLNQSLKTVKNQVYLLSDDIKCTIDFVGREESLKKIGEAFDAGNQLVFLHGFGGIGKTELAKMYAQTHRKQYDAIIFLKYDKESTLQELFDEVQIENFEGDTKEHRRKLRTLLTENVLVLIDNFDVEMGSEIGIELLLKTKANILVTSRTDFSDIYKQCATQIEVDPLSCSELERVFISNANITEISSSERLLLIKVLKLIEWHTFATVLLARQMHYSGWDFDTLYTNIGCGLKALSNSVKIVATKDERTIKDNSLNILRAIFHISSLTEGQQQVLRSMYLLNFVKITKEAYLELTTKCDLNAILNKTEEERMKARTNSIDDINDLVELGLISVENGCFTLHKLVYELVDMELTPDETNCANIYFYMLSIVDWFAEESDDSSPVRQAEAENKAIVFLRFLDGVDLSHQINLLFALRWLEHIFESSFYVMDISYIDEKLMKLYARLETFMGHVELAEKYRICMCLFKGWLYRCNFFFIVESEEEYHERELCEKKSLQFFHLAISYAAEIDESPTGEHTLGVISHVARELEQSSNERAVIRSFCGDVTSEDGPLMSRIPKEIIHEAYAIVPSVFNINTRDKRYYDFPLTDEELDELPLDSLFDDDEIDAETREWINGCHAISDDFRQAENKGAFLISLPTNNQYTPSQKVSLLEDLLDRSFGPISFPQSRKNIKEAEHHLHSMNWEAAESLLNLQSTMAAENDDHDWCDGDEESLSHIPKYRAILSAMFVSDDFGRWVEWAIETDNYYKAHYLTSDVEFNFGHNLSAILTACTIMRKCRYILPFLTRELVKELSDVEEVEFEERARKCYPMIEATVICAENAIEELGVEDVLTDPIIDKIKDAAIKAQMECFGDNDVDEDTILFKTYSQACDFFSKILDWITNKKFDLKPEEK